MRIRPTLLPALILTVVAGRAGAANDIQTSGSFVSTLATGTAPLAVASTTRVDNLNAQYLDGWSAASFLRPLENVITVSPSGGDFTSIQAALNSITDAASDNRYTVLVGPGEYNEQITLKSEVAVVGSGPGLTVINGGGSDIFGFAATVVGANAAELRNLTVDSNAASSVSYAIGVLADGTRPLLRELEIYARNGTLSSVGIYNASNAVLHVEDSLVQGSSSPEVYGILNFEGSLDVRGGAIHAYSGSTSAFALANSATSGGYTVYVRRCEVDGDDADLSSDSEFYTQLELSSVLGGGVVSNGGGVACNFVVDETPTSYTSSCP